MRDFISGGHDFRGGIRRKGTNPRFVLSSNTNGRTRNSQRNCRKNWIALCGISAVREIWNGWAYSCGREAAPSGGPSLEKEYTEDPKRYTSGIVLETEVQPTLPTGVSL